MSVHQYLEELASAKVKQEDGSYLSALFKAYHDGQSEVQMCHNGDEAPNPVVSVDNEDIMVVNCG